MSGRNPSLPPNGFALGGPIGRISVSLRVMGDEVDPAEVTRLLGVEPDIAARKGEPVRRGDRTVAQRSGIWSYTLGEGPSTEWELDDAIATLLGRLPADLAIWDDLGRRFRMDLFCGVFLGSRNQGCALRPSTLRLMADRGITLSLDIYAAF